MLGSGTANTSPLMLSVKVCSVSEKPVLRSCSEYCSVKLPTLAVASVARYELNEPASKPANVAKSVLRFASSAPTIAKLIRSKSAV